MNERTTANTRLDLRPLACPRCGRKMQPLVNGGVLYLRCEQTAPRCGILVPADTALAWENEDRVEVRPADKPAPTLGELRRRDTTSAPADLRGYTWGGGSIPGVDALAVEA